MSYIPAFVAYLTYLLSYISKYRLGVTAQILQQYAMQEDMVDLLRLRTASR